MRKRQSNPSRQISLSDFVDNFVDNFLDENVKNVLLSITLTDKKRHKKSLHNLANRLKYGGFLYKHDTGVEPNTSIL